MIKKFLLAVVFTASVFTAANAQVMATTETKTMTKEEKAAAKAKKEAELNEAFTTAGLTSEEQLKCRAALDESNEKSKAIRADAALTADDKKVKLDAVNKERNDNMKTIMGDAKYKIFKATQKAQKEVAGTKAS